RGSDQWGNIINGIDLTRRVDDTPLFGLTSPLLTTSDGRKMGKSQGGAVWLNGAMLSHYEFWQFWRNTTDADVGRFLKLYTELPVDECDRLGALEGSEINAAKVLLANEVTTLLHGADAAVSAEATARQVFEQGGAGGDLEVALLPADTATDGLTVIQALVQAGLVASGKEAKRLIAEGGLRMDNEAVTDPQTTVDRAALEAGIKVSVGKKKHRMLRLDTASA
ncbi:MAG: tyrosine--tRNA ligase, partial [Paracoccus sp. (in: a-proteobacteria)]|nr:tyrosine--tRNA ligase [Paracoccus sp. (in: a-proteobacteria)]